MSLMSSYSGDTALVGEVARKVAKSRLGYGPEPCESGLGDFFEAKSRGLHAAGRPEIFCTDIIDQLYMSVIFLERGKRV